MNEHQEKACLCNVPAERRDAYAEGFRAGVEKAAHVALAGSVCAIGKCHDPEHVADEIRALRPEGE